MSPPNHNISHLLTVSETSISDLAMPCQPQSWSASPAPWAQAMGGAS